MANGKQTSVRYELKLMMHALDRARAIEQRIVESTDECEARQLAYAAAAIVIMLRERLRLVDCIVRDEIDSRKMWWPEMSTVGDDRELS